MTDLCLAAMTRFQRWFNLSDRRFVPAQALRSEPVRVDLRALSIALVAGFLASATDRTLSIDWVRVEDIPGMPLFLCLTLFAPVTQRSRSWFAKWVFFAAGYLITASLMGLSSRDVVLVAAIPLLAHFFSSYVERLDTGWLGGATHSEIGSRILSHTVLRALIPGVTAALAFAIVAPLMGLSVSPLLIGMILMSVAGGGEIFTTLRRVWAEIRIDPVTIDKPLLISAALALIGALVAGAPLAFSPVITGLLVAVLAVIASRYGESLTSASLILIGVSVNLVSALAGVLIVDWSAQLVGTWVDVVIATSVARWVANYSDRNRLLLKRAQLYETAFKHAGVALAVVEPQPDLTPAQSDAKTHASASGDSHSAGNAKADDHAGPDSDRQAWLGGSGRILAVNRELCRVTGWSPADLIGKSLQAVGRQTSAIWAAPSSSEFAIDPTQSKPVGEFEVLLNRKDGARIRMATSQRKVNIGGLDVAMVLQLRDVSKEHAAHQRLLESESKFRELFEAAPAMMWLHELRPGGKILINSVGWQGLSANSDRGLGDSDDRVARPTSWVASNEPDASTTATVHEGPVGAMTEPEFLSHFIPSDREIYLSWTRGEVEIHPTELQMTLGGKLCSMLVSAVRLGRVDQSLIAGEARGQEVPVLIACAVDLQERKDLEMQLIELSRALDQRVRDRTAEIESFAYSVSHDLRAPLRAIGGFARILSDDHRDRLSLDGLDRLSKIESNVQRMEALLEGLLTLARLSTAPFAPRPVDLTKLAKEVFTELRLSGLPTAASIEFQADLTPPASGDPVLLRQLLVNLIANAIKFSRTRAEARICFGYSNAEFFVSDNGVGFDPKYADQAFGVFERLHRATEFEGSGIGLAIVKRIVARHSGKVRALSTLDEGTSIRWTLALADPPPASN